jgi:MFS family permease
VGNDVKWQPTSQATAAVRRPYYGWVLLFVFWLILVANLAFPMYGGAVLNSAMAVKLGFTHTMLGLPFAVFLGVVGLSSPLVAAIIYRIGVKPTLILGNGAVLVGALLMALVVRGGVAATLIYGLVIGFGVAAGGNLTAQTAIPRWFAKRRSLAFALVLTASAVGGTIAPPLLTRVVRAAGGHWQIGWYVVAALAALAMALAALAVFERPEDIGQHIDGAARAPVSVDVGDAATAAERRWPMSEIVRSPALWAIGFASAMATGSFGLVIAHGIANAEQAGYSANQAAWAIASMSLAGLAGKAAVAIGRHPIWTWCALMFSMGSGLAIAATSMPDNSLYLFAVLLGAGFGGVVASQPASIANFVGAASFARIASLIYFLQAVAGIVIPWLAGRLFDAGGSYHTIFCASALGCAASGTLLVRLVPRHGREARI